MSGLYTIRNNTLALHQHPGQLKAWDSQKRFIAILAGTQGGKTSWLPWWLWREIRLTAQAEGGNDYLAVTASYDLFKLKFLPAIREVFEHIFGIGRYWSGDRVLELADPATGTYWAERADDPMWGRIILRSAEAGGGLESATARAAIFDEAGQDSATIDTYWAIRRRLALHQGRLCLGTTLYNLGWLKSELYNPWEKANRQHPEIDVIQFDSITNPSFPEAEYEAAEASLPKWKFDMMYRGLFTRPAGLIYDVFDELRHTCPPFALDPSWRRLVGLDFGGINTAGVFVAEEPVTKRLFLYREYHEGNKTSKEHAEALIAGEPMIPFAVGGAPGEDQWRREFAKGGLSIRRPDIGDVELGIERVYGALKRGEIVIFDSLTELISQLNSYSREVDSAGNTLLEIKDKSKYHLLDAVRYVVGFVNQPQQAKEQPQRNYLLDGDDDD